MDTIARLLQEAIDSYNLWASVKARQYNIHTSHNDLQGIFYNKLIAILSVNKSLLVSADVGYVDAKGRWIRNYIKPLDMYCSFIDGGYIKNVRFYPHTGSAYSSLLIKQRILDMLIEAQKEMVYSTKTECSMAIANDIVEQVKNYKHV